MHIDGLRIGRAGAVAVIALGLLVGIVPFAAAQSFTAEGYLRLQMGAAAPASTQPGRWVLQREGVPDLVEAITVAGKCLYGSTGPSLAVLSATGGNERVGVGPDSIGVDNGPKGVACYRISENVGESLAFSLGSGVTETGLGAFFQIDVDIEVKDNAIFQLDVTIGDIVVDSFFLTSGGNAGATISGVDEDHIFRCDLGSDSGPDSGGGDNCKWPIEAVGTGFVLTPIAGEGSLEGGGDYGVLGLNDTVLHLISGVPGFFGCENGETGTRNNTTPIVGEVGGVQCQVVRQDIDPAPGEDCQIVSYLFRADAATNSCELISQPNEQLIGNIFVKYGAELAPSANGDSWVPAPPSRVSFGVDPDPDRSFPIPPCRGNTKIAATDPDGPQPIEEIGVPGNGYDRLPGVGEIEYACAFKRTETLDGGPEPADETLTLEEGIQFWGDIRFSAGSD